MLGYDNLSNYFKTNFALMQHHKYSLSDLEYMIPWERQVYMDLIKQYLKKQAEEQRDLEYQNRRR